MSTVKRQACDTCFSQKERCAYTEGYPSCDRCRRLSRICRTRRAVRRAGRPRVLPPVRDCTHATLGAMSRVPASLHPFAVLATELSPVEEMILRQSLDPSNVTELMSMPWVGVQMHKEAMYSFLSNYDLMHDGVFSMYEAFASAQSRKLPDHGPGSNLVRGTRALKKFRDCPCPTSGIDFQPWLWLGTCLLVHTHCALGSGASSIRRYMLHHLNDLGEQGRQLRLHPVILSLTILDIYDCLLHRRLPIMSIPEAGLTEIDPLFGLCAPLVRFLFELCSISYTMAIPFDQFMDKSMDSKDLEDFERSVQEWQPAIPPGSIHSLSPVETAHVLTQTSVHKTLILLFIHRLRCKFGHEDLVAQTMARSIVSELDLATVAAGQAPKYVGVAFIVAAMEAKSIAEREKVLQGIPIYFDHISRKGQQNGRNFLRALWQMRDEERHFRWIDRMECLPPLLI